LLISIRMMLGAVEVELLNTMVLAVVLVKLAEMVLVPVQAGGNDPPVLRLVPFRVTVALRFPPMVIAYVITTL
jgi:hypothetical protein